MREEGRRKDTVSIEASGANLILGWDPWSAHTGTQQPPCECCAFKSPSHLEDEAVLSVTKGRLEVLSWWWRLKHSVLLEFWLLYYFHNKEKEENSLKYLTETSLVTWTRMRKEKADWRGQSVQLFLYWSF